MGQWRIVWGSAVLLVAASHVAFAESALTKFLTDDADLTKPMEVLTAPPPPVAVPLTDATTAPPKKLRKSTFDPYSTSGFDDGVFELRPTMEIDGLATNNVYLSPTNRQSDTGFAITPGLTFQSKWPVHEWTGAVSGTFTDYLNHPDANTTTGSATTTFRLDIRRDTFAEFNANLALTQAPPGSDSVPSDTVSGRRDLAYGSYAALTHDFGPAQMRFKAAVNRYEYGDVTLSGGGIESNADRNFWSPVFTARGTWGDEGARLKPFVELSYDMREHDEQFDRNGQQRNSQGYGAAVGLELNDGPIWQGEISGNFIARSYDDPALQTAMALGVGGNLTWSPTPLFSVVATTGVALNDATDINVSATPSWNAGLTASYALRDNVSIHAGGAITLEDVSIGADTTTVASAGAEWKLNPYLSLSGTLQSTWFTAAAADSNYDEQRAMIGVVIRP